jgi:hypothetical protein
MTKEEKECLATFVNVGGFKAWALWDSGSTTTGITPMFSQVADIPIFPLLDPHVLQLRTIGRVKGIHTTFYIAQIHCKTNSNEKVNWYVNAGW